jgi:hypothetical protein
VRLVLLAKREALDRRALLVRSLIKHVDYFRCVIRARQAHFRMFSSRKANTSGCQMFTPRWRKSCPSSTVWPMGG